MRPSYVFQVPANAAMPSQYVYKKPKPFKFTGDPLQDAPAQWAMARGLWHDELVDVEVVFGECDDGINVEWKVRLLPCPCTAAKVPYTVRFGYIDRGILERQGPRRFDMALQMASQAVAEVFPWREERVEH